MQNLDLYIYKNSIKTADIGLTAHVGGSPTKFEIWFRKRKPGDTWTLQSMNEEIKNAWTDEISTLLWNQAKRNRGKLTKLAGAIESVTRHSNTNIYFTLSLFRQLIATTRSSYGGNVINGSRQSWSMP